MVTRISVFILVKYLVRGIFMKKETKVTTNKNVKKSEKEIVKKEKVKKVEKKKNKKSNKTNIFKAIFNFLKGVKSEMNKVTWPNKKNMVKYTVATVVFIVFFALFFYGIILLLGLLKDLIVIL